mgnify:CR=1 FL=1
MVNNILGPAAVYDVNMENGRLPSITGRSSSRTLLHIFRVSSLVFMFRTSSPARR